MRAVHAIWQQRSGAECLSVICITSEPVCCVCHVNPRLRPQTMSIADRLAVSRPCKFTARAKAPFKVLQTSSYDLSSSRSSVSRPLLQQITQWSLRCSSDEAVVNATSASTCPQHLVWSLLQRPSCSADLPRVPDACWHCCCAGDAGAERLSSAALADVPLVKWRPKWRAPLKLAPRRTPAAC